MSSRSLALLAVSLPLVLWGAGALALDQQRGAVPPVPVDAIVVAGCRVDPGGVPSACLAARTAAAVALWRGGVADRVVFTGGVGTHPPAEAVVAADHAAALGLARAAMVLETRSTSTQENALYAADQIGSGARVVVVTDDYHTMRARRVFARHFDRAWAVGVAPEPHKRVVGALREVLALAWYAARGRL